MPYNVISIQTGGWLQTMANTIENDLSIDLFSEGYRVAPFLEGLFVITRPAGLPGRRTYVVNPTEGKCDCPASKPCKHLKGLCALVFDTADDLGGRGLRSMEHDLLMAWGDYTAEMVAA